MENSGRFEKGNEIGKATRFKNGNTLSCKYKEEYADALLEYFFDEEVVFPTIEGFAKRYKLAIRTVKDWIADGEKYPRFALAHAQAMAIQKDMLLVGGLTEKFNPQIVKFLAINNHGMKEKVEQDIKSDGGFDVNINVIGGHGSDTSSGGVQGCGG